MAQQGGNDELKPLMVTLFDAFHEEDDRELLHRAELDKIFRILDANREKITSRSPELEKKEELVKLLREIHVALQRCKARSERQRQSAAAAKSKRKTIVPSVSDCNPFKSSKPSPETTDHPQQDDDDDASPLSVEPLLRQTIAILGDAPPLAVAAEESPTTTEFYEWTTSYVNEERIFGWDEEASKVVDALVGAEDDGDEEALFRAAGIAGIHGSGKTVLAQKVFVHDRIKDAFPLRLWVCVGPPDHEDRPGLLYRMLDNLGVDTDKVESIVKESGAVKAKAAANEEERERSRIGVLLYILHVTLDRTGHPYLIVFDDIRAYAGGPDRGAWYSNLTLRPPRDGSEWYERLAYGLPKARKSAVLVTCRKEDDARAMVRTGSVIRPPGLGVSDGWMLFKREYEEAKNKEKQGSSWVEKSDKLYMELEEMKEKIVGKCLGLPVAIVEAAKGFAVLEYEPHDHPPEAKGKAEGKAAADETAATSGDNEA